MVALAQIVLLFEMPKILKNFKKKFLMNRFFVKDLMKNRLEYPENILILEMESSKIN